MSKKININLTELAGGAAQERFDQALVEVVKNILDVNTDAKKARKVTLTVSIKPNEQRELGDVVVEVKTALAPNVGVPTTIMMGRDSDTGKIQAAEGLANYTKKGSLIGIEGRIQTRNYENQQGQRVYITEVVANNSFSLLESKSQKESHNQQSEYQSQSNAHANVQNTDPFANGQKIDISDDDLPF